MTRAAMPLAALLVAFPTTVGARAPMSPACRPAVERALPDLRAADALLARGDARSANARLDAGLRTVGDAYRRPDRIDDSGLLSVFARTEESKGRFASAARIKRRLLRERLELCGSETAR